MSGPARVRVAVDIGGTFTDVVAFDEETGAVWEAKATRQPSPPASMARRW